MRICEVSGCGGKHEAHGYCVKHLRRVEKYGQTELPQKRLMKDQPCGFEGCSRKARYNNLCNTHAEYRRRHGHLNYISTHDRFMEKVQVSAGDDCWAWTGCADSTGRGNFQGRAAPRAAYWFLKGIEPPSDMYVCHTCDNPNCVNPDHLFLGTQKDNILDMISKGRGWWQSGVKPMAAGGHL